MNKALLCLVAALAVSGCSKSEDEDATSASGSATTPKAVTPVATPKPGDWMWKNAKGTPRNNDPFSVPDDPFAHKPKKQP